MDSDTSSEKDEIDKFAIVEYSKPTWENRADSPKIEHGDEKIRVEETNEKISDYSSSEQSHHSHYSNENETAIAIYEEEQICAYDKNEPIMKVNSKFPNAISFRRALNHHALTNLFEYSIEKSDPKRFTARCVDKDCQWRIHASILQDDVTFQVKTMEDTHTCTKSNNESVKKRATQGWIADRVVDKLKAEGNVSVSVLRNWLRDKFNVDISYLKVYRGKEQALKDLKITTPLSIKDGESKRPRGRPRKNEIVVFDETKKRHRCAKCGLCGHHQNTCKKGDKRE